MNQRLSIRQGIFNKILLAFVAWFVLSLPVGLFDYLLIHSHFVFIVLFQRAIHFGICLLIVMYLLREKVVLEYNDAYLIVTNKSLNEQLNISLSKIQKLSLKPKLLRLGTHKFQYQLEFIDDSGLEDHLMFSANPGNKLKTFLELVKKNNPDFTFKNQTFY